MNRLVIKVNLALIAVIVALGVTCARAQWPSDIGPPPGWLPGTPTQSNCEEEILVLSTCPEGTSPGYYSLSATTCKTSGDFCCEYETWEKVCYVIVDEVPVVHSSAGYAAAFNTEYFSHLCPGTGTNVTCIPYLECRGGDC